MKIMVVDDSQTMVRILSTAAKKAIKDVEVFPCYNGEEAFNCINANKDIKLILLDVNMPVMSGKEFLIKLRENSEFDDVKVIMQTTETAKAEIKEMMGLGISGYLMKPYQTKRVMDLMTQLAPIVGYELI